MSIYLDHNATTPLDPRVWAAMAPYLRDQYANPSSVHAPGRMVRTALEQAREQVAALVKVHPSQVIFTSGGTEANNLAIKGTMARCPGRRLAVSAIEHASVLQPARALAQQGWGLDAVLTIADIIVSNEESIAEFQKKITHILQEYMKR